MHPYYGGFSLGSGAFEYALATDPAANGGAYADVKLLSDSAHNGVMEVHFSMLRGSPGFYSTAMMTHRKQDVGVWLMTNMEFSNGGPLKRDVSVYPYSELNNSILTGELGMGSDGFLADGVTAAPQPIDATGFNAAYSDDASIHLSDHGPFSDERINFPAKLLHAGENTITIQMDARKVTAYLMLDYLRLELSGYVPPAPARVTAYAGDDRALLCWPLVPGATSYNVLRSTTREGLYAPVAMGFVAPVVGSGPSVAQYVDKSAANGNEYRYKVQSVNPAGSSELSLASAATKPSP